MQRERERAEPERGEEQIRGEREEADGDLRRDGEDRAAQEQWHVGGWQIPVPLHGGLHMLPTPHRKRGQ